MLRVLAEQYEDIQKARISATNRALRGGVDAEIYAPTLELLAQAEHTQKLALGREYRRAIPFAIREWQQSTPGIGEHLLARLLGTLGHPRNATPHHWIGTGEDRNLFAGEPYDRGVRQLWSYCGHGDPERKRRKGMTVDEAFSLGNPRAKMLVHLLAEATIKLDGPFRAVYDADRASRGDVHEGPAKWVSGSEITALHSHNRALRRVGKEILRALWIVSAEPGSKVIAHAYWFAALVQPTLDGVQSRVESQKLRGSVERQVVGVA